MDARRAGAIALSLIGIACRIIALALSALTVALCFTGIAAKLHIVAFVVQITQALPDAIAGYGLIPTPLGGVFRFDFALMSALLFMIDYACARIARWLR